MNALQTLDYGSLVKVISDSTTGFELTVNRKPIAAKTCNWDVTESYCRKPTSYQSSPSKLKFVRSLEIKQPMTRTQLTVDINGSICIYTLGKKNEYFANGVSLTKTLQSLAQSKGNKINIY